MINEQLSELRQLKADLEATGNNSSGTQLAMKELNRQILDLLEEKRA